MLFISDAISLSKEEKQHVGALLDPLLKNKKLNHDDHKKLQDSVVARLDYDKLKYKYNELTREFQTKHEKEKEREGTIGILRSIVRDREKKQADMSEELSKHEKEIRKLQESNSLAQLQNANMRNDFSQLALQHKKCLTENSKYKEDKLTMNQTIERLQSELETYSNEQSVYETDKLNLRKKIDGLQKQMKDMESKLEKSSNEIEQQKRVISNLDDMVQRLNKGKPEINDITDNTEVNNNESDKPTNAHICDQSINAHTFERIAVEIRTLNSHFENMTKSGTDNTFAILKEAVTRLQSEVKSLESQTEGEITKLRKTIKTLMKTNSEQRIRNDS